jgi:hypothetical protein
MQWHAHRACARGYDGPEGTVSQAGVRSTCTENNWALHVRLRQFIPQVQNALDNRQFASDCKQTDG